METATHHSRSAGSISQPKDSDAALNEPERLLTARTDELSEADSLSSSSFVSDEDQFMHDTTGEEHGHHGDSPTAAIDALKLKQHERRGSEASPSSSHSSGVKRKPSREFNSPRYDARSYRWGSADAAHNIDGGKLPASTSVPPGIGHTALLYDHSHGHSRAKVLLPGHDVVGPVPGRYLPPDVPAHFVPKQFDKSNRIDSAFAGPLQNQLPWPKVPPVAGLLEEDVFDRTPPTKLFDRSSRRMFLQPQTAVITQGQLAAEIKGIYAGLVMVEAKSINIDAQQTADPKTKLAPEQWQALIALRRTLLYEHHDFLMATQHPSANPALNNLAAKYCMPARLWKHGIHGFLEVLRHRRPESQEYMLTFIYLAYEMMALLYETVPAFTDTWIECLGDLARYRMAIEEDKEIHAIWGGVAARWYTMASDRRPQTGRLYHHLGILERPSLRKFYYYSRSLTSVLPFINARESLGTLCAPILQDDAAIRHGAGAHSAEAMTICYHARVFSGQDQAIVQRDGNEALGLLTAQTPGKIASYATSLAVVNIASLWEFGLVNNVFKQLFAAALARDAHNARPSIVNPVVMSEAAKAINDSEAFSMTTYPTDYVIGFFANCFNNLLCQKLDHGTIRDLLQYVNVNLVWLSSLLDLRAGITSAAHRNVIDKVLYAIDWAALAGFLNGLAAIDPLTDRIIEHALHNIFPMPQKPQERKPLIEDYLIRGLAWAEGSVDERLFGHLEDDDGSRALETQVRLHLRAERVEWRATCIARPSQHSPLTLDRTTKQFGFRAWAEVEAERDNQKLGIKTEFEDSASPASSNTMSGYLADEYDTTSVKSETQFTPSIASIPSRLENSYVDIAPMESSEGMSARISLTKKSTSPEVKIESAEGVAFESIVQDE